MSLYTNSTGRDTVLNAFHRHCNDNTREAYLAAPFFSNGELVEGLASKSISVRLLVRLGPATSPEALYRMLHTKGIQVRYFTSPLFHSKLFIFGDSMAIVGSANLTLSGLTSNREIAVEIPASDERFAKLQELFGVYWQEADVLNNERLAKFEAIMRRHGPSAREQSIEKDIGQELGDVRPGKGIQVGTKKISAEKIFLESYRRTYQEFREAYNFLTELYEADGRRRTNESELPLRIEIDNFLSFVREQHGVGESFKEAPFRTNKEVREFVSPLLDEWFALVKPFPEYIIPNFARIQKLFSDKSEFSALSAEEIFDGLDGCHSFHDRKRFYKGGWETMRRRFLEDNEEKMLRTTIHHLLFGKGDYINRMGECIFDPDLKLHHIGRSVIQELIGWQNSEDIPICNQRTVKAMRYLGFKVLVFGD